MPIIVKKQKGERKEDVIARFRRLFMDEGILDEIKERVEFVKDARKRYEKKKARKNHPDKGGDQETMKSINSARDILLPSKFKLKF